MSYNFNIFQKNI